MQTQTTLFRARVPAQRLKRVEAILEQLGMKPGDALNLLLAQIELRRGLPFDVTTAAAPSLLSSTEQAAEWSEAFGDY